SLHFTAGFDVDFHSTASAHGQVKVIGAERPVSVHVSRTAHRKAADILHGNIGGYFFRAPIPTSPLITRFNRQASIANFCFNFGKQFRIAFQYHALGGTLLEVERSRYAEIQPGEVTHVAGFFFLGNRCRGGEYDSREGYKEYSFHGILVTEFWN